METLESYVLSRWQRGSGDPTSLFNPTTEEPIADVRDFALRPGRFQTACGGLFGSAMTFASGEHSSAPGQIPIEQLRVALATLAQASSGR